MLRLSTTVALVAALVVTACATQYGRNGLTGGYTDEKIDDTHYRVKFHGNGYASSDRVWGFWLYRCAELTKEKGFSHFALLKPGSPLSGRPTTEPAEATRRHAAYQEGDAPRMVKTKGGGAPSYIYIPGHTVTTWHSDAVVAMYKEPLPEGVVVLKAQTVLDDLGPYVRSNGETPLMARDDLFRRAATMVRPQTGYRFGGEL